MRVLALDVGQRRTGVAVSDASGRLARPLKVLSGPSPVDQVIALLAELAAADQAVERIVVGRPTRLNGTPNEQTPRVDEFVEALGKRTSLPIVRQDERLTSVEAERLLAVNERDWRRRKIRLDAAAAAVILQEYLDLSQYGDATLRD
jgi:putative Holliday junction resolvase